MNKLIKFLLLLCQIGGGAIGLILVMDNLFSPDQKALIIHMVFGLIFVFGIVAGVTLLRKPGLGLKLSMIFQAIQIPIIISPAIAYRMFSGATFFIYGGQGGYGAYLHLGGRYFFWFNGGQSWLVGINFIALGFFIFLLSQKKLLTSTVKPVEIDQPVSVQEPVTTGVPGWRMS